ncbi:MAG: helix-turn-helix transcriptional regulator [Clostridiales bacterium]|nr:helix-turn-helix transcriptional regulator [Clostridiales bacterium]
MSRLGDLIHTQRTQQKMTLKQVAKKTGVSEKFLQEVESGKKIIADDQAKRILKAIGVTNHVESHFSLEDVATTVDLKTISSTPPASKNPSQQTIDGSLWLDALSSMVKKVPVVNHQLKEVDSRFLPLIQGKVEGGPPDKVFYYLMPDTSMLGYRIGQNDLLLFLPAQLPIDNAIMLLRLQGQLQVCQVKTVDASNCLLLTSFYQPQSTLVSLSDIQFLGRCVRVEISFD